MNPKPIVLAIGGMDPSAGAGILADVKAIEAAGAYGMAVLSANTFQNDAEYDGTDWTDIAAILSQIQVLQRRHQFAAVKIGLIQSFDAVATVCQYFGKQIPIVWDPVLKASAGFQFHTDVDRKALADLLRNITLLTPNLPEAEALFGTTDELKLSVIQQELGCAILLKGGHALHKADDVLLYNGERYVIEGERFNGKGKHGTGCVLSSAIAARLALRNTMEQSCLWAKRYVEQIMQSNPSLLAYHNYNIE